MNFQEAQDYLFSLGNEVSAMKLGLDSVDLLLDSLGNPQTSYLKVQVAGTNGKGSVCAFLDSICSRAGIDTGVYTSPHLVSITERIRVLGAEIAENDFARLSTKVRAVSESLTATGRLEAVPTYFEQVTAIALLAFAEAKVELAILETGLGGRLDATTAARAEVAAITRIDLDHQRYLGETLKEIAAEKAAIIHPESKVVALRQSRVVDAVIEGRCREVGVEPAWATQDISILREPVIHPRLVANFRTERATYRRVLLWDMLGEHQVENAAIAIGLAELLQDAGFKMERKAVEIGLETAGHPGRLEWIGRFLLDGAHNLGGAKALGAYLDAAVNDPAAIIFAAMDDKNVAEITSELFPRTHAVVLTRPDNSRAMTPEQLLELVPIEIRDRPIHLTETVAEAIEKAVEISGNGAVVITGSLYLVGEAKRILESET
ncbi:MAG TPA: Mur ligase family protein [Pyrinomonadaceae bacterium]|nr:Mur ligase family protein [Pyrinomonadaceae bacterium]